MFEWFWLTLCRLRYIPKWEGMNIGTGVGEQSSLTGGTYGDNREEGGGIYSRGKMIWRAYQVYKILNFL